MRGSVVVVVAAGAIGCLLASLPSARANSDEEDALIRRAIQLRKHGDDRAAHAELRRAYEIARSPRAAAQLGFAEQALGMWPQAEGHVREALAAPGDPWIRKHRATVEESLATIRSHVGRVQIEGGQPGAQVSVNGQPVGALPLREAVPVSAGPVDIEVRGAGFESSLKTIHVAAGELARVPFTLRPVAPPPQARTRQPALPQPRFAQAPVSPLPASAPGPAVQLTENRGDAGRGRRMGGIGLVAGGVAAIGGGVAASVVGKNKFDAIGADAAADRPYNVSNGNWKTYETAAAALYVVGGVAVVGGVVLYMSGRPGAEERRPPAVSSISLRPVVAPSRAGASLSVRF